MFAEWLERHFPLKKQKVLERIRAMHDGGLNDSRFGVRMRGAGKAAELLNRTFLINCRRLGLNKASWAVSAEAFRRPGVPGQVQQRRLFE